MLSKSYEKKGGSDALQVSVEGDYDIKKGDVVVAVDPRYFRPTEVESLFPIGSARLCAISSRFPISQSWKWGVLAGSGSSKIFAYPVMLTQSSNSMISRFLSADFHTLLERSQVKPKIHRLVSQIEMVS